MENENPEERFGDADKNHHRKFHKTEGGFSNRMHQDNPLHSRYMRLDLLTFKNPELFPL
jgi:hypothetical protein